MTSGIFESVPIDSIWVDRAKRQRQELPDIGALAASIKVNGLIHPPVIKRDGELVVGERRWTACKSLGWTHMPIQWVDELDEDELLAVEFEENMRRVDLPWQDQTRAIQRYHALQCRLHPGWSQVDTADRLGVAYSKITEHLAVARALDEGHKLVVDSDKFTRARNVVRRIENRKNSTALADLDDIVGEPTVKTAPILLADFHEWAPAYTGPKFNFLHCDFPYGIGIQRSERAAGRGFGVYDDRDEVYWQLLHTLEVAMDNVVAPSAHLMFWFSMERYGPTIDALTQMGWKVNYMPLVWYKSDNTGIIPDPNRGPRQIYETCLFASRGDRMIKECVGNAFAYPGRGGDKDLHMNQKPVPMLKHFMRMFVDETSYVLDPTAGSGSAIRAASGAHARHVLGLEINPEFHRLATEHFNDPDLSALAL